MAGESLSQAYRHLHAAGLRVSYPHSFFDGSFECEPVVASQRPQASTTITAGDVVTLAPRRVLCSAGGLGVPVGRLPSARVPVFVGQSVATVRAWTHQHRLYWQANWLPPLRGGGAPQLLANYIVRTQTPRPGSILILGIAHKLKHGGTFRPTPLTVRAVQR